MHMSAFRKTTQNTHFIGMHRQQILYERLNMLCTLCGRLGQTTNLCTYQTTLSTMTTHIQPFAFINNPNGATTSTNQIQSPNQTKSLEGEWKIV